MPIRIDRLAARGGLFCPRLALRCDAQEKAAGMRADGGDYEFTAIFVGGSVRDAVGLRSDNGKPVALLFTVADAQSSRPS